MSATGTLGATAAGELAVEAHALLVVLLREGAMPVPAHLQPSKLAELQDALLLRLIELGAMPADESRLAAVMTALSVSRSDRLSAELQAAGQANPSQRDALVLLEKIGRNFEAFARQINKRHNKRSGFSFADEYDVQDAFHAILRLHFEDVREEEYGPSVAGKHGRMDFLLQQYRIGVETKMTRKGLGRAELIGELAEDTNQVEIWFGIMSRKALRGASFKNVVELSHAIEAFIAAYTPTPQRRVDPEAQTAKPFK